MKTTGRVNGIISNIVIVKADGPVGQNEICHVYVGDTRMMAEVIKVVGDNAYVQVFDSTRGLKIGDKVEFEGHMLEVTLAPGMLSRNYDGLQNDLEKMDGLFIARGSITDPVDFEALWEFKPLAKAGDKVSAASWLGEVQEQWVAHKIMVPFTMTEIYTVKSVAAPGKYKVTDTVAVVTDAEGHDHDITMVQKWPVKQAIRCYTEKPRPSRVMETGVRAIDTFNPMAEGGTGFIPGPFGAGKTVLQHAISKQAEADIIIMVACGERANEVVEIFKEFPELVDPRTGHKLMERTIIICNTSNMPVAAREASVYTGMTIGEYYRSMGLKVLVMADSTSRWAQALREMSNRLEELPGQARGVGSVNVRVLQWDDQVTSEPVIIFTLLLIHLHIMLRIDTVGHVEIIQGFHRDGDIGNPLIDLFLCSRSWDILKDHTGLRVHGAGLEVRLPVPADEPA